METVLVLVVFLGHKFRFIEFRKVLRPSIYVQLRAQIEFSGDVVRRKSLLEHYHRFKFCRPRIPAHSSGLLARFGTGV